MIDNRASPGCHLPTQGEFLSGLRGMPIYDDTRGVPERTKGSRKSRASNEDGWTAFDLRLAHEREVTVADLNRIRTESRAWVDAFKERVRADLVARGVDLDAPIPGCGVNRGDVPF